jgi:hypothetical protein
MRHSPYISDAAPGCNESHFAPKMKRLASGAGKYAPNADFFRPSVNESVARAFNAQLKGI